MIVCVVIVLGSSYISCIPVLPIYTGFRLELMIKLPLMAKTTAAVAGWGFIGVYIIGSRVLCGCLKGRGFYVEACRILGLYLGAYRV